MIQYGLTCKDCDYMKKINGRNVCFNHNFKQGLDSIDEDDDLNNSDKLFFQYNEGGRFYVGDYFACCHCVKS